MRIHFFIHDANQDISVFDQWVDNQQHTMSKTIFPLSDEVPDIENIDALIILGGIMGSYDDDKFLWMKKEKKFIEKCIVTKKKTFGICLGVQLIANVLGSRVYVNKYREIGWHTVTANETKNDYPFVNHFPNPVPLLEWHGDTFDLPANTVNVMETECTKNQCIIYENHVVGFQFHPEFNRKNVLHLIDKYKPNLLQGKYIQSEEEILANIKNCDYSNALLTKFLNEFL